MRGALVFAAAVAAVVVAGASLGARAARQADPISGKWGADGQTFLELVYNQEGVVTGTTIWRHKGREERAEIEKGTFDSETGTLELTGEAKDRRGQLVRYLIKGRLEQERLTGSYEFGGDRGEFSFTKQ